MARIAVVILNWNGEAHLRHFLPSVVANTPDRVEIWVADNGSTDNSVLFLRQNFPGVGVLELDRNYGFAEGYNRAITAPALLRAEYFVLLNSDVETPPEWIEPLIDALDQDKKRFAVSPKVLSLRDRGMFEYAGASGGFIDILGYPFCRGRILSALEKDRGQYDDTRETFWATGACMAIRAEAFRKLGGFDNSFFAHMEEIDLCWRAQLAGWKVAVVPDSRVYHLGGGTLDSDSPHKLYLNYRNNLFTLYKNLPDRSRKSIIPARMVTDGFSALLYLLTFRPKAFRAVWDAHRDYRRHKPILKVEREGFIKIWGEPVPFKSLPGVYRGSIVLRYIFGKRIFADIL